MRLSATGGFVPSSAVRVRVQVPSSVQVTVVTAAAGVPKVQLAPASMPMPRRGPQEGRAVVGVGHAAREGDAAALGARGVGAGVDDRRVVGQRAHGDDRGCRSPLPPSSSVTVTVTVYVPGAPYAWLPDTLPVPTVPAATTVPSPQSSCALWVSLVPASLKVAGSRLTVAPTRTAAGRPRRRRPGRRWRGRG